MKQNTSIAWLELTIEKNSSLGFLGWVGGQKTSLSQSYSSVTMIWQIFIYTQLYSQFRNA
jgi:hypothetical protein